VVKQENEKVIRKAMEKMACRRKGNISKKGIWKRRLMCWKGSRNNVMLKKDCEKTACRKLVK
jgi:hypothetical protein